MATMIQPQLQLSLYRTMLTIRRFEERCNYLFMQGRIPSTLHLYIGQEAVAVGVCAHLRPDDYVTSAPTGRTATPSPRASRLALDHGRAVRQAHRLLQGQGRLDARRRPGRGHVPRHRHRRRQHPAGDRGWRWPSSGWGTGRVAVAFFGDGATNEGAFHEGAEHGRHLGPAGGVRLREQPVRRLDAGTT